MPTTELQLLDQNLSIESIFLPSWQPRQYFDSQAMDELVQSVREHGILEPLLVRHRPDGSYELIAGERRLRAAQLAGLLEVPVVVKNLSDRQALLVSLVENLQREDLNPLEETEGILQLLRLHLDLPIQEVVSLLYRMQNDAHRLTHHVMGQFEAHIVTEVFSGLGMSWESFVNNRLPLLKLPEEILRAVQQGQIAYTKAKVIARVKDREERKALLAAAICENLSLAQVKARVAIILRQASAHENSVDPDADTVDADTATQSLRELVDSTYQSLKKAKVWHNPEKRSQLQQLLSQLQALIAEG